MQAKQEAPEWIRQLRQRQTQQLIKEGFVRVDDFGDLKLTEKGARRAGIRLDKLPPGDEILLEIAFCEAHGLSLRMD